MPRFDPHPEKRPAIVAGASSGIGAATAVELAAQGHPVALGARRVEILEDLAGKIRAEGGTAFAHRLDVTDQASVDEFVAASEAAIGPTEILVSGAGDIEFGLIQDMDPADFAHQVQIHLIGAQRMAHAVLPGMLARRRGDVVLISSDCAPRRGRGTGPTAPPRPVSRRWSGSCGWNSRARVSGRRWSGPGRL